MSAVFSYDALTGPQYVDLNGIAAGYGIVSVPVTDFLSGDQVQTVALTIEGTALATIQLAIDMVQRTCGFYEYTDQSSIDAHFTITRAQIAAIAAATECTYSVVIMILRNGVQQIREVQAGSISARAALPAPPLIVNAIVLTGGPVSGSIGQQAQLTATCYDGLGNVLPSATVTWDSGNSNVATVDATGLVTFVTPGVATITASSQGVSQATTATCSNAGFIAPTNKQVPAYNAGLAGWFPTTLVAAYLSISAGALVVGGGWPAGATELAPGAAAGYVRSNGSAFVRVSGVAAGDVTAGTFGAGAYTFPSSLVITSGLTVNAGTSALQAMTATSGVYSGTVAAASFSGPLAGNAATATALATPRTISITGDLAYTSPAFDGSGNVTAAGTLATVNANVGSFGSSTAIPNFTVNAKGLITAAGTSVVIAPAGTLSGTVLAATVVTSSLTTIGVLTGGTWNATAIANAFIATGLDVAKLTVGTTLPSNIVSSSLTAVGILASPHMTGAVVDSGGLTVTLGGLTVSAGTTAVQALTATTGVFASSVTAASFSGSLGHTLTIGAHLTGGSFNNSADVTIATDATSANIASAIVARDGSGNFIAGTITAALAGNASTATNVSGTGITGTTLASNVVTTSITTVGVLAAPHMTAAVVDSGGFTVTAGAVALGGDFAIATTKFTVAAASGNTAIAGTLGVSGVSTFAAVNGTTGAFSGSVSTVGLSSSSGLTVSSGSSSLQAVTATTGVFSSTLAVTGDFTVNTTKFIVVAASGNVTVAGTLGVAGTTTTVAITASGLITGSAGLTISSGTSAHQALTATTGAFSSTLSSTGDFAVNTNKFTVTASSGNTAVAGTFNVTGATTLAGVTAGAVGATSGTFSAAVSAVGLSSSSGLTVSSGTSALQAVTATTVGTTGALTVTSAGSASIAAGPNGGTNPVWQVDSSTASQAAGLKLTGAVAAGSVALVVLSSGSNANLTIDAKGSGTVTIAGTSSGTTTIGAGVTITSAGVVSATGSSFKTAAMNSAIVTGQLTAFTTYGVLSMNGGVGLSTLQGLYGGDSSDKSLHYNVVATGTHSFEVGGGVVAMINTSGGMTLSSTLTVSAGGITVSAGDVSLAGKLLMGTAGGTGLAVGEIEIATGKFLRAFNGGTSFPLIGLDTVTIAIGGATSTIDIGLPPRIYHTTTAQGASAGNNGLEYILFTGGLVYHVVHANSLRYRLSYTSF